MMQADDVIIIDITPVNRKTGRYEVIAKHGGADIAQHSAADGYSALPGVLRKIDALGFSRDIGIEFYRGTTLVFLRRTLGAWLGDYEKKRKAWDKEEDGE